MGYGLWVWVMGYGLWVMGYGLCSRSCYRYGYVLGLGSPIFRVSVRDTVNSNPNTNPDPNPDPNSNPNPNSNSNPNTNSNSNPNPNPKSNPLLGRYLALTHGGERVDNLHNDNHMDSLRPRRLASLVVTALPNPNPNPDPNPNPNPNPSKFTAPRAQSSQAPLLESADD